MSSHITNCYICKEKVSFSGKSKHFFSKKHSEDIQQAILKKKEKFMEWINDVSRKIKKITPTVRFHNRAYHICLMCKKITPDSDSYVNCLCGKTTENAQAILDILNASTDILTTSHSEDSLELQEEIKKLKAENEKLRAADEKSKQTIKKLQSESIDAEEPYDCLFHILTHCQEKGTETFKFNDLIELLKGDCYSNTYSKVKKDLDIED